MDIQRTAMSLVPHRLSANGTGAISGLEYGELAILSGRISIIPTCSATVAIRNHSVLTQLTQFYS